MIEIADIRVPVRQLDGTVDGDLAVARRLAVRRLRVPARALEDVELVRRSIDARRRGDVRVIFTVGVRLRDGEGAERAVLSRLRRAHAASGISLVADGSAHVGKDAGIRNGEDGAVGRRGDDSGRPRGPGNVAAVAGPASCGADAGEMPAAWPGGHAAATVPAGSADVAGRGNDGGCTSHESSAATHGPSDRRVVVVGAGCAGLFCALALARAGLRPLLVERGDDVTRRSTSIAAFNETGVLDAESNVQFGMGGAGTFSDGKLATGTKSPHHRAILQELVAAGAPASILYDAHPHVGSDVLPGVVANLVREIEGAGGEVRTRTALIDLHLAGTRASAVTLVTRVPDGGCAEERVAASAVVVACGHSARDVFALLAARGVCLERKPFAMGARIEHAQAAIDRAQYGTAAGHPALGAAPYKLSTHVGAGDARRGVFSFCMCPGGYVVAAASEPGGVVTNGMSLSGRDGTNANAGLLVDVRVSDIASAFVEGVRAGDGSRLDVRAAGGLGGLQDEGNASARLHAVGGNGPAGLTAMPSSAADEMPVGGVVADADTRLARGMRVGAGMVVADTGIAEVLAGIALQRACERAAFAAGGGGYVAPAQLVGDFLRGVRSAGVGSVAPTYPRGVAWGSVEGCLPAFVVDSLRAGIPQLARRLRGFDVADAVLTGVETRSSSPVRVVRGDDGASVSTAKLYPCGEGAGYAGGIMSAAADGLRCASWVAAGLGKIS